MSRSRGDSATPGATCATSWTGCTWSPSPPATARVAQRSIATTGQKTILAALELSEPPRFVDFTLTD